MIDNKKHNSSSIILFDGVCNLCNGFVQFVLKRDRKKYFLFGSLQSDEAKQLLKEYNLEKKYLQTIILIEENKKVYTQSTAALRIAKKLNGGWKLFYGFIIIPKFVRDALYNWVARNRYKWFGKKDSCMTSTADLANRFISH